MDILKCVKGLCSKNRKVILGVFIMLSLPAIWLFVYYTGGIKYVFSHTMYIPILMAGIFFGMKSGLAVALVGGILLGPLMPIDVGLNEKQEFINWFYRLLVFLSIGGLSGYASQHLRKINKINERLFAYHIDTGIPNINYLVSKEDAFMQDGCLAATIYINNKNHIIEVLGIDFYHKTLYRIYELLMQSITEPNCVIQPENNRLWIAFQTKSGLKDIDKVTKIMKHEISINDIKVYIDYSIGIAYSQTFKNCKSLEIFKDTDKLAHYAKDNNMPYAVYDKSILKEKYQFDLLSMFSDALINDDTFMVYQPVIRSDNEVESLEALIRWKNPVHGLIMPNDFIPLVESTQLIHPMTEWVVKKVVKKQNEMKEVGIDIPLSINLSVKNLYDQSFHKLVKAIIQEEKGNPEKIIFEITETMLLKQNEHLQENLNRLKECGFKFAIDDFGKGYSSMSYLCQYPLDYIKIDRFFINEVAKNKSMFEIVSTMIKLAHQLNLQVVAEGVETKEINDMIHLMDCKLIQGYFIAKPMEDSTVIEWIKEYGKLKDIEKLKSS